MKFRMAALALLMSTVLLSQSFTKVVTGYNAKGDTMITTTFLVVVTTSTKIDTFTSVVRTPTGVIPLPPDTTTPPPIPMGNVLFQGDWAKKYGGYATPNYKGSAFVVSGTTWHGLTAAKVTIDNTQMTACTSGDCNRAEVAELPNGKGGLIDQGAALGQMQYMATSLKVPLIFKSSTPGWWIPLQLHGPSEFGTNPLLAIEFGGKKWSVNVRSGDYTKNGLKNTVFPSRSEIAYDKWTDIIIGINFQKDATGSITIWRRDEGEVSFTKVLSLVNLPTLQFNSTGKINYHYWKQGIYRFDTSRVDSLLIGPFVVATTFEAAEKAAFNTSTVKP